MPVLEHVKQHKLLLDTHVWVWSVLGNTKLLKSFQTHLNQALAFQNVFLSPMSIWEIGMLAEKGRLNFGMDVLEWVNQVLNSASWQVTPITAQIAIRSTRLNVHGDPVDRILLATASELRATLVTCDKKLLLYGNENSEISVYDPTEQ